MSERASISLISANSKGLEPDLELEPDDGVLVLFAMARAVNDDRGVELFDRVPDEAATGDFDVLFRAARTRPVALAPPPAPPPPAAVAFVLDGDDPVPDDDNALEEGWRCPVVRRGGV